MKISTTHVLYKNAGIPRGIPYSNVNNPQSLNLYSYVGNNPLSKADADGHFGDYYNTSGKKLGSITGRATAMFERMQVEVLGSYGFGRRGL